jgi:hypothetical protein
MMRGPCTGHSMAKLRMSPVTNPTPPRPVIASSYSIRPLSLGAPQRQTGAFCFDVSSVKIAPKFAARHCLLLLAFAVGSSRPLKRLLVRELAHRRHRPQSSSASRYRRCVRVPSAGPGSSSKYMPPTEAARKKGPERADAPGPEQRHCRIRPRTAQGHIRTAVIAAHN